MRDKVGWAATSPRIASAQARLAGDEELLSMMELLQKANMLGQDGMGTAGLGMDGSYGDLGPLTGPAHSTSDNIFDRSFSPDAQIESPVAMDSPDTIRPQMEDCSDEPVRSPMSLATPVTLSPSPSSESGLLLSRISTTEANEIPGLLGNLIIPVFVIHLSCC